MTITSPDELRARLRDAGPGGAELQTLDLYAATRLFDRGEIERVDGPGWRYRLRPQNAPQTARATFGLSTAIGQRFERASGRQRAGR